ncbi:Uncharacterised protein [Vibrio cholerae]|nr:Uncharacterised protein [Vibrio cholerae]
MTPEVTFLLYPPSQTSTDHWTIDASGKLLHTSHERRAIDQRRNGLNQSSIWVTLHPLSQ